MNAPPMNIGLVLAIAGATAFEGLRAGAGTFRILLDLPARVPLGPIAFAEFSRATDLSPTGVAFYVFFGVGGALVTSLTWLIAVRSGAPRKIRRLLAVAAISSLLILVMTAQAAPLMWRVGSSAPDPVLIGSLLDRFTMWTVLRVVCADVSFLAVLSAFTVTALARSKSA
jgi:hypothetical protein